MTRGWERLSERQREKLFCALAEGDPDGEVGASILGKELLREVYSAPSLQRARWHLVRFYEYAAEAEVPELTRLATTVSRWEQEILSFHVTRISMGPVEAHVAGGNPQSYEHRLTSSAKVLAATSCVCIA